jgi:type III secretory pathway lipoprotein EscJ
MNTYCMRVASLVQFFEVGGLVNSPKQDLAKFGYASYNKVEFIVSS